MTWFRIDDTLAAHPKTRKAQLAAIGLWTVAGSWSSQQLTEGFVPCWYVETWPQGRKLAAKLVEAGLWHAGFKDALLCGCVSGDYVPDGAEEGFQFHEFTERNPTAEQEKGRKASARERQRRAREKAAAERERRLDQALATPVTRDSRHTSRVTNGVSHGPPDPTRPDPTQNASGYVVQGGHVPNAETPPPKAQPTYPDHCPRHAHTALPGRCGDCKDVRKANRVLSVVSASNPAVVPHCGKCDETRHRETQFGVIRCPECHPRAHVEGF